MLPDFSYVRPKTIKEALALLESDNCRIHAGGTDLLGCLREEVFAASRLVGINRLPELTGVKKTSDGGLRIGAMTTITEVSSDNLIRQDYAALAMAASEVGTPQLRNQGTIGGNLCQKPRCWYYRGEFDCLRKGGGMCYALGGENQFHAIFGSEGKCCVVHPSDTAPALVALGAKVRIVGPQGTKTVLVENFFVSPKDDVEKETILEPNEIVTEILVPSPINGQKSSYRKIRARKSWDFALAGVALALVFSGKTVRHASVVLSGAAPVPWRPTEAERIITGKALTPEVIEAASEAAVKDAQPLQHNGYKIPLFRNMLKEELGKMRAGG
jgi:xanthine dehydrogenase YagS FAD-binding subunit